MKRHSLLAILTAVYVFTGCNPSSDTGDPLGNAQREGPIVSFVETQPGVELEVLEWSDDGLPLIFLAGASHTAHVFEDFAPHFLDRFRVLGITRRRVGASSVPPSDYGIVELGTDIIAVMDHFSIERANFVSHSFGGAELTELALHHDSRIEKLVYIDGAWDFKRVYYAKNWWDPWPKIPMTVADSASSQAVADHHSREWGPEVAIVEIEARHRFDETGKLVALNPNVGSMFRDMIGPTLSEIDFSAIQVPVLAIRSLPQNAQEMFPGFEWFDGENRRIAEDAYDRWARVIFAEGERFAKGVIGLKELALPGAHHEVHIMEPERIIQPIRDFLLTGDTF